MSKKKTTTHLIPLIIVLTIIPLIVRLYEYKSGLAQFDWYQIDDNGQDFFLYYKAVAIILTAAVMCVVLAVRYKAKKKEFKLCYELIPLLIYAVMTLLSSVFSKYRYFSFHGVCEMYESLWVLLGYCVIAFYAYEFINTIEDVDCVMKWLTVGLGVMLVVGVLQAVGHDLFNTDFGKMLITSPKWWNQLDHIRILFEKGRVFLTSYNPNYVASYFSLMIPMEAALLIKSRTWIYRIIYIIMLAASLLCLLASGNRSGILAFAAVIVLAVIMLFKQILKAWKVVLPLAAAAAIFVAVFFSRNNYIIAKFQTMFQEGNVTDYAVSKIVTGDEDVAVTYLGQVFHVSYDVNESDYVTVSIYDDAQQAIETVMDNETYTYTVSDERFSGVAVQLVKLNDEIGLDVKAGGIDWYFQKGEDNTYYFYNVFGRLDKINNAPHAAEKFLGTLFGARGRIWSKTIPLLKSCILFGSGADTYALTYPQDDYVDKVNRYAQTAIDMKPHCFYLQVAIQSGIPAFIALMVFYIWYFITSFKLYSKAQYQDPLEIVGAGLMFGTFTYMVCSTVNDSTVTVAPIYWLMMGMGLAVNELLKRKAETAAAEAEAVKVERVKMETAGTEIGKTETGKQSGTAGGGAAGKKKNTSKKGRARKKSRR